MNTVVVLLCFVFALSYSQELTQDCSYEHDIRMYICKNIVDAFPKKFYGNYHLKCVKCQIPVFSQKTFPHENGLVSFNVSHSGIQVITRRAFSGFVDTQYIYLQDNKLRNISQEAFYGLRQVYELHLERNMMHSLTPGFLKEFQAISVNLSENFVEEIPDNAFEGSLGIMTLDLSHNKIRLLNSESFGYLDNLEQLDLSFNYVCHVPFGAFKHLDTLKELNLAHNKLRTLTVSTFSGLTNLDKLNISGNRLAEFDSLTLLPFTHISSLDLSKNSLFSLDSFSIHMCAPSLRSVVLDDNLWSCSFLQTIILYLKTRKVAVENKMGRYDVQNIFGIACTEAEIKETMSFKVFMEAVEDDTKKYNNNYC